MGRVSLNFVGFTSSHPTSDANYLPPAPSRRILLEIPSPSSPTKPSAPISDLIKSVRSDVFSDDFEFDPKAVAVYTLDFISLPITSPSAILRDGDSLIVAFHSGSVKSAKKTVESNKAPDDKEKSKPVITKNDSKPTHGFENENSLRNVRKETNYNIEHSCKNTNYDDPKPNSIKTTNQKSSGGQSNSNTPVTRNFDSDDEDEGSIIEEESQDFEEKSHNEISKSNVKPQGDFKDINSDVSWSKGRPPPPNRPSPQHPTQSTSPTKEFGFRESEHGNKFSDREKESEFSKNFGKSSRIEQQKKETSEASNLKRQSSGKEKDRETKISDSRDYRNEKAEKSVRSSDKDYDFQRSANDEPDYKDKSSNSAAEKNRRISSNSPSNVKDLKDARIGTRSREEHVLSKG